MYPNLFNPVCLIKYTFNGPLQPGQAGGQRRTAGYILNHVLTDYRSLCRKKSSKAGSLQCRDSVYG